MRVAALALPIVGAAWLTWFVISPGIVTANEFHVALLLASPPVIVALCMSWAPSESSLPESRTRGNRWRAKRPPWV